MKSILVLIVMLCCWAVFGVVSGLASGWVVNHQTTPVYCEEPDDWKQSFMLPVEEE